MQKFPKAPIRVLVFMHGFEEEKQFMHLVETQLYANLNWKYYDRR